MPWSLQYRAEHMQNSKLFALQSSLLLWISVGTKGDAWEEDRVDVGRLVRFWKSPAWQLGMFGIYTYIIYITSSSFPSSTSSSSLDSARKVRDIVRFGEFPAHPLPNATLEDRNGIAAQQVAGQDVETAEHRLQPSVPTTELYTYIALWLNDFQGDIQALRIPRSMVPRSS
jgi:hypothetical protein